MNNNEEVLNFVKSNQNATEFKHRNSEIKNSKYQSLGKYLENIKTDSLSDKENQLIKSVKNNKGSSKSFIYCSNFPCTKELFPIKIESKKSSTIDFNDNKHIINKLVNSNKNCIIEENEYIDDDNINRNNLNNNMNNNKKFIPKTKSFSTKNKIANNPLNFIKLADISNNKDQSYLKKNEINEINEIIKKENEEVPIIESSRLVHFKIEDNLQNKPNNNNNNINVFKQNINNNDRFSPLVSNEIQKKLNFSKPKENKINQNHFYNFDKKQLEISGHKLNSPERTIKNATSKKNININSHSNLLKKNLLNLYSHKNLAEKKDDEFFEYEKEKPPELSKEEKAIYGDRMMKGYIRDRLLGKGGCGAVWLSHKKEGGREIAIKQTSKKSNMNTITVDENINIALNEIQILKDLNNIRDNDGKVRKCMSNLKKEDNHNNNFSKSSLNNCDLIPEIFDYYEDSNDIWFSFEKGGKSLSNLSFKIKGQFEKGERIYFIQKGLVLYELFNNANQLKFFVKKILEGIDYINDKGIVHSDIKSENILIDYDYDLKSHKFNITNIKIIDYGSAFYHYNINAISSNTPEYLCPEITINNKKFLKDLNDYDKYINSVDIWSFGIILLELCLSCPIWMNYKSKVILNGKPYYSNGLFGCRGRDGNKMYNKQIELGKNVGKILKNSLVYLLNKEDRDNFIDLLSKMLNNDYKKRITTKEALKHEFLNN